MNTTCQWMHECNLPCIKNAVDYSYKKLFRKKHEAQIFYNRWLRFIKSALKTFKGMLYKTSLSTLRNESIITLCLSFCLNVHA